MGIKDNNRFRKKDLANNVGLDYLLLNERLLVVFIKLWTMKTLMIWSGIHYEYLPMKINVSMIVLKQNNLIT